MVLTEAQKRASKKWRENNKLIASYRASECIKKRYNEDPEFREIRNLKQKLWYITKTLGKVDEIAI
jgi:hypothetical protein